MDDIRRVTRLLTWRPHFLAPGFFLPALAALYCTIHVLVPPALSWLCPPVRQGRGRGRGEALVLGHGPWDVPKRDGGGGNPSLLVLRKRARNRFR